MNSKPFKQQQALARYIAMGPDRSLVRIGREFGVTTRLAENWSKKGKWADKVREFEARASVRLAQKAEDELVNLKIEHRQVTRAIRGLFIARRLKDKRYKPSGELAISAMKYEKELVEGDGPQSITASEADLGDMQEEEIERIILERIKRVRSSRSQDSA